MCTIYLKIRFIFFLIFQVVVFNYRYNLWTYVSLPIITIGLVICTTKEVNFDVLGVVFSFGASIFRGAKTIVQKLILSNDPGDAKSSQFPKLDSVALLFYMAPQAAVMLLISSLVQEGWAPIERILSLDYELYLWLAVNCANACLLNIFNFMLAKAVSPIASQLLGNVKTVLSIFVSAAFFSNSVSPLQFFGSLTALFGVWVYQKFGKRIKVVADAAAAVGAHGPKLEKAVEATAESTAPSFAPSTVATDFTPNQVGLE